MQSLHVTHCAKYSEGRHCYAERARFLTAKHLTSSSAKMPSASEYSLLTSAEVSDCLPVLKVPWTQAGFGALSVGSGADFFRHSCKTQIRAYY